EDHQNKYRIENMVSIARKDRGKSKSERSYKMLSFYLQNMRVCFINTWKDNSKTQNERPSSRRGCHMRNLWSNLCNQRWSKGSFREYTCEHQYSYDQCSFSCIQHNQLKSHILIRTHTEEKPFKCDLCNYAAAWNVQLKDHNKVHGMACQVIMCQE
ncbi:myoneurin-like, partial [Mya arenaria]|uniref:myoneurin-like n=1 Tax=Mya arenaria TaxID=6604 RepID=UPI0022E36832